VKRIPVSSTNVASVGYENQVLVVEFLNGSVYQYFYVPIRSVGIEKRRNHF